MRAAVLVAVLSAIACNHASPTTADAGPLADAPDTGCQPRVLLAGGQDLTPQGWSVVMQGPATLTREPDYTHLVTTTADGARTGGQLLLSHPGALEPAQPFKLQVILLVESTTPHNQFDSGAAILASFTPPFGANNDRSQMVYLDASKIGWADDSQSFATNLLDGQYHTYELSVDAAGLAALTLDGTPALTRTGFTSNGTITLGDQTNEPNLDSALRLRSVTQLCP